MHSATAVDYTQGETPTEAYEQWKENWQPPQVRPLALYGRVIVEFAPYAHKSNAGIWTPERASYSAKVVDDSEYDAANPGKGGLPPGTEVAMEAIEGTNFNYEERVLCVVNKSDILAIVTD